MRSFLSFLLLMAAALLVSAALAYPAWLLVNSFAHAPIHRVAHRIAMLAAAIGLIWLARRQKLGTREIMGYGIPRDRFIRQLLTTFAIGLALMIPWVSALFALHIRSVSPNAAWTAGKVAGLILQGLMTGFVVAFLEETFFRGVLQSAVERESGTRLAILLPALLYGAVHFLGGKLRVPDDQIRWGSGFDVLANLFTAFSDPLHLVDSFCALFLLGVMLALLRKRTGAIACGIGLHAAGVFTITLLREATVYDDHTSWSWLVGAYDHVIGWGAALWFVVIIAVGSRLLAPRAREVNGEQ